MIHVAKPNSAGYVGMIRTFVARSTASHGHSFRVGHDLTVFVFNDRLVVVGKPPALSGDSQSTVDMGDSAVMMGRAHRSSAPRGIEVLRSYLGSKRRQFPFEEIVVTRISRHCVTTVCPAAGAKRNGTGVLISYPRSELVLVGRADHVQALDDWLARICQ